jgi:hypothetical protein
VRSELCRVDEDRDHKAPDTPAPRLTSAKWPAWSAPMVGTSAMRSPFLRQGARARRRLGTVRTTRNLLTMEGLRWLRGVPFGAPKLAEPSCLIKYERIGHNSVVCFAAVSN